MTGPSTAAGGPQRAVTVFTGPSLRPDDRSRLRELATANGVRLDVRPPVRRHDLLALRDLPADHRVLMLDGEFGQNLAVSVTEIRAVLRAGIRLHGASSMGVLRAVECRTLGMTGSGWVYEQYASGRIESDAEVALLFDPYDFQPVTVPLVNLRWLIGERVRAGRITTAGGTLALEVARAIHYRDRRPSVVAARWRSHLPPEVRAVLEPELDEERMDGWDRKRLDGLAALREAVGG
ncbi:TfuA-like protein [Micromonospora sp. CPCC 205561]|uniref:TfuA-like protein n=1 Tax=Micromonospora sp. CPCC 205561 TaxID=3122407 RepID=UPI002FF3EFFF